MTMAAFLEVHGIHKRFGGVHALRGIHVTIERGGIYHLLGENGCGKSTLIKIISGAQPPDEGSIRLEGRDHASLTPIEALAAGIETVYQDLSLIPNLSVAENVALSEQLVRAQGRLARRLDDRLLRDTARRALATTGLPTDDGFLATVVSELPLAVRQLVAIARAIATRAKLVIMDEPTTSLTRREVDNLIRVVGELQRDQVAVLFVTHKLDECYRIGGQAIVFRDGQCVAQGPINSYTKAELGQLMTGRLIDGTRYRQAGAAAAGAAPLLQLQGLGCGRHFQDVSLSVARGEIIGITGLADSGRNELALALAGVMAATQGQMLMEGRPVQVRQPSDAIAHGIGYVPEDRLAEGLFLDKPILANMAALVLDKLRGRLGLLDAGKSRALAQDLVQELRIATPNVDLPVQSLSGGNQQRVLIGRWLTIAPRLLLLHGPTVGVDVGSKDTIYKVIQSLSAKGMGLLVISDDLPELLQNCDRILVMRNGRIAAEYAADAVQEEQLVDAMLASDTDAPVEALP
ncbi:sugar ABC transporter ATP-binding protein [Aquincola tertiaricarbonis]|uniref:Sugar ABC transporter ATP-binding protein n=1 Tax=Aquincola tertiaricarbonis TaxID=391953 RepID=A0ABY4S547_AQUTE|nr:sugar ABC transporter ATP-binding protein [Aquincola tertiaricarbonis]URI06440.1 sugar ABC transporter ATP-binding protein [Aquincola tertiaricarbonis]